MWGIEEDDFDGLFGEQATAQTFDPVGFLSPFTIQAKCLFQQMWEHDLEWDNELPNDLLSLWQEWCTELLTSEIEILADVIMLSTHFTSADYFLLVHLNTRTLVNQMLRQCEDKKNKNN